MQENKKFNKDKYKTILISRNNFDYLDSIRKQTGLPMTKIVDNWVKELKEKDKK